MSKFFLLAILLNVAFLQGQTKNIEKEILKKEIIDYRNNLKTDTVLVAKETMVFLMDMHDFRIQSKRVGMSESEIDEIFGKEGDDLYEKVHQKKQNWCSEYFGHLPATLYDIKKHKANEYNPKTAGLVGISKPLFRKDKKFALLQTFGEHSGQVLSIYKFVNGEWVSFKRVTLKFV